MPGATGQFATLHRVDVDAVPALARLNRGWGYVERQVTGWTTRFDQARTDDTGDWSDVVAWVRAHQPDDVAQVLVHNDYRFDNLVLDDELQVAAVLDWEMATVGDPLMDLSSTLAYWVEAGDSFAGALPSATTLDGFPSRSEVLDLYADRSGRDLSRIGFYTALGYWKLACILQGVADRYRDGAMADDGTDSSAFDGRVEGLATLADDALDA